MSTSNRLPLVGVFETTVLMEIREPTRADLHNLGVGIAPFAGAVLPGVVRAEARAPGAREVSTLWAACLKCLVSPVLWLGDVRSFTTGH